MSHKSCDDPLCRLLSNFEGQNVTIITTDDDVIEGELVFVRNCVVGVLQTVTVSPFTETQLTLIRCSDIERASITLTGGLPPIDNGNDESPESPESPESS